MIVVSRKHERRLNGVFLAVRVRLELVARDAAVVFSVRLRVRVDRARDFLHEEVVRSYDSADQLASFLTGKGLLGQVEIASDAVPLGFLGLRVDDPAHIIVLLLAVGESQALKLSSEAFDADFAGLEVG